MGGYVPLKVNTLEINRRKVAAECCMVEAAPDSQIYQVEFYFNPSIITIFTSIFTSIFTPWFEECFCIDKAALLYIICIILYNKIS